MLLLRLQQRFLHCLYVHFQKKKKKKPGNGRTVTLCPDKTSRLKLIPNQTHLFPFIPKFVGQSELIRVNPRFFNPNQNSGRDFQSECVRDQNDLN